MFWVSNSSIPLLLSQSAPASLDLVVETNDQLPSLREPVEVLQVSARDGIEQSVGRVARLAFGFPTLLLKLIV
jgi:hypothetical protein